MPPEGQTVVRAAVQARLLGIRLLSIDARIVLGPATPPEQLVAHPDQRSPLPASTSSRAVGAAPGAALARALELLADVG